MVKRVGLALTISMLIGTGSTALAGSAGAEREVSAVPKPGHFYVYKSIRPGLSVSLTRGRERIIEAGVSAPGLCSDGKRQPMGFSRRGGGGIPINGFGRFEHRGIQKASLSGRFVGAKVVGVFHQSYLERGRSRCGNIEPKGRRTHYVAWLVEVDGRKVPHPPIRGRAAR